MNEWERNRDRSDYAVEFRNDAKADSKNGQNVVSHTSMAEVQAPESVKTMVEWRTSGDPLADAVFDPKS